MAEAPPGNGAPAGEPLSAEPAAAPGSPPPPEAPPQEPGSPADALLAHLAPEIRAALHAKSYRSTEEFLGHLAQLGDALRDLPVPRHAPVGAEQATKDALRESFVIGGEPAEGAAAVALLRPEAVLCAASRTATGGDAYFVVADLFGESELLVKPSDVEAPPIEVVFGEDGSTRIESTNVFAVYSRAGIDSDMDEAKAFALLHTMLTETLDADGRSASRRLAILGRAPPPWMTEGGALRTEMEYEEYEVEFERDALGLGVKLSEWRSAVTIDWHVPFVKRRDGSDGPPELLAKMKGGDMLLSVNGIVVEGLPFAEAVNVLRHAPHGRTRLRFRRPLNVRPPTPPLVFECELAKTPEGGFGVNLQSRGGRVVVHPVLPFQRGAAGEALPAEESGKIRGGDIVVAVGGENVRGCSFDHVVELLHAVEPAGTVALGFERRRRSSAAASGGAGGAGGTGAAAFAGSIAQAAGTQIWSALSKVPGRLRESISVPATTEGSQRAVLEQLLALARRLDEEHLLEAIRECSELLADLGSAAPGRPAAVSVSGPDEEGVGDEEGGGEGVEEGVEAGS